VSDLPQLIGKAIYEACVGMGAGGDDARSISDGPVLDMCRACKDLGEDSELLVGACCETRINDPDELARILVNLVDYNPRRERHGESGRQAAVILAAQGI
jgi:hypothetical protein